MRDAKDATVALMREYGVPLTRENWLYLEFQGAPPLLMDAEIAIPAEILRAERQAAKAFDAQFLRSIGVRRSR
jgi:hypothetical protein